MSNNTSIELGKFGEFVESQVKTDRYGSKSEVVRAGLRLLQEHEIRMEALRTALIKGEQSGEAVPFDFKNFMAERKANR